LTAPELGGVRAVDRALEVLTAFSLPYSHLSLAEIAEATEIPKPTVHRLLRSLARYGMVRQDREGRYLLGLRLLEMAGVAYAGSSTVTWCEQLVDEIYRFTKETILVLEIDWVDNSMIVIRRRDNEIDPNETRGWSKVGRRSIISITNGAMGKAALAGLPQEEVAARLAGIALPARTPHSIVDKSVFLDDIRATRERGYAYCVGEFLEGITAVAIAIVTGSRPIAVVGVVIPSDRSDAARVEEIGSTMIDSWERVRARVVTDGLLAEWSETSRRGL
jgi:DNA-binding IclR family transcriptional regulator